MAGGEEFDPKALQEDLRRIRERLRRLGGEGEAVMKKLDETITEAEKRLGPRVGPRVAAAPSCDESSRARNGNVRSGPGRTLGP